MPNRTANDGSAPPSQGRVESGDRPLGRRPGSANSNCVWFATSHGDVARDDPDRILAGAIAITALALVTDLLLRLAESMTAISRARRAETR